MVKHVMTTFTRGQYFTGLKPYPIFGGCVTDDMGVITRIEVDAPGRKWGEAGHWVYCTRDGYPTQQGCPAVLRRGGA